MIADAVIHLLQQGREDRCPIGLDAPHVTENEDVRRRSQQRDGAGLEYCAVEPIGRPDNQPDHQRRHDAGEVGGEN
jgi:hypothetical protein